MKPVYPRLFAALALCVACGSATAATYRIDDTGTALDSTTRMTWRQLSPSRRADNTMEGRSEVRVHLNLAPWLGKSGRIFMVLPEQSVGPVRATWPAHGRFLAGELRSGQRALVYAGPITTPVMEGLLLLGLEVDGTRLDGLQRISFHFEIDLD